MEKLNTIIMMGFPGSGKGTQSKMLAEKTGFKIFSSGEKFRELSASGTELGEKVGKIIDSGDLMPHWFATYLFQEVILNASKAQGLIFEGAGRKRGEAEMFNEVANWLEREYKVIYLSVPEDEAIRRMETREGDRKDDDIDVSVRIDAFKKDTAQAVEFFRSQGKVIDIDGNREADVIHQDIVEKLGL